MYQFFNQISNFFSQPFFNLANQWEGIPILSALLLGLVGAAAPCQFTGNLGAITIYGNRSLQENIPWLYIFLFILGKIAVFTSLGAVVWIFGKEFYDYFTKYVPFIRKLIGPLLILIGLFMVGLFHMRWNIKLGTIPERLLKDSKSGSFLMGVSFTLAFCPTMFVLFFMTLMPVVLSTSYGVVLPSIFALGTSIPLLVSIFIIWYFGMGRMFMKRGRKLGGIVQKVAGWTLVILGLLDTITYW
ncbi:urease accessory protein UreH domain-containing protein [Halobacillus mangrovi]|uniref:urease accessory protein UreH domain-containing protein n=1 Tax=Halobacillus mangrovi TaxID=402384 RepID=UPI003D977C9F